MSNKVHVIWFKEEENGKLSLEEVMTFDHIKEADAFWNKSGEGPDGKPCKLDEDKKSKAAKGSAKTMLDAFTIEELREVYKVLQSGKEAPKFKTKEDAKDAVWPILNEEDQKRPEAEASTAKGEEETGDKTDQPKQPKEASVATSTAKKPARKAKAKAAPKEKKARRGALADDAPIKVLKPDAYREGSNRRKRLTAYAKHKTVGAMVKAGFVLGGIRNDIRRGVIRVG